jgi:flagellar biosynthesis protein FlhF
MKIKRFFAADIRQAMRMVKEELGADAVIMSNRAVEGGIEIVAARDFDEQSIQNKLHEQVSAPTSGATIKNAVFPRVEETRKPAQPSFSQRVDDSIALKLQATSPTQSLADKMKEQSVAKATDLQSKRVVLPNFEAARKRLQLENERKNAEALAAAAKAERRTASPYQGYAEKAQLVKEAETVSTPVTQPQAINKDIFTSQNNQAKATSVSDSLLMEMSKEIKYLRSTMDTKFANISWALNPDVSSLRNDLLQRLTNMGISRKLGNALVNQLSEVGDIESAFMQAQDMLTQALPIAEDDILENGGIVALVGPTGVGKTTTIAKLAAKFILKHGSNQVALVTTDNYRIGAHDQLNTYGRILNVPVRVASCADDLCNIINSFSNKRLILIDTAGMCQHDMKLVEQINTLQQNDLPIQSYLVMSAATEYKAINSIIKAFSVFEPKAAILTKVDEAVMIGSAISSLIEHNLPLSFITDGQQVPEDFHDANAQALIVQCVAMADTETESEEDTGYQPWGAQAYA